MENTKKNIYKTGMATYVKAELNKSDCQKNKT